MNNDNVLAAIICSAFTIFFVLLVVLLTQDSKIHAEYLIKCVELTQKPLECRASLK